MFRLCGILSVVFAGGACATAELEQQDFGPDRPDIVREDVGTEVQEDAGIETEDVAPDEAGEIDPDIDDRDDATDSPDDATDSPDDATEVRDDAIEDADVPEEATPVVCGDGTVAGTEQCDDGNLAVGDGCSDTCTYEYCGDGLTGTTIAVLDDFETGDLSRLAWVSGALYGLRPAAAHVHGGAWALGSTNGGVNSTTAEISLRIATEDRICFWYAGESESCCDHFIFYVDGTSVLQAEGSRTTWTEFCADLAPGTHDFRWTYQKDSSVHTGWDAFFIDDLRLPMARVEECDDGNMVSGDGCSAACRREVCGNAVLDVGEECDDGNTVSADGCSATCTTEFCGDGVVGVARVREGFESGDLSRLPWTPGTPYGFSPSRTHTRTGSFALGPGNIGLASTTATIALRASSDGRACFWYAGESESCCDHFAFAVDGTEALRTEGSRTTWTEFCAAVTPGYHDFAWSYSKDGSINTGWDAFYIDDLDFGIGGLEDCDDGNTVAGDGCGPTCRFEVCGNGIVDVGETCDDGDLDSDDGCTASCHLSACGDTHVNWSAPSDAFETGDLTQLPWSPGAAELGWAVQRSPSGSHTGQHMLASQNGGRASTTSWVEVPLTTVAPGRICFWYQGESESCCDHLYFRLDGTTLLTAQGTVAWTEACYDVPVGTHVFRWEYSKDASIDTGTDRFVIDDVRFPPVLETCDDGNTAVGDGCNSNCRSE
jgi:cysteine-rich repeat protein